MTQRDNPQWTPEQLEAIKSKPMTEEDRRIAEGGSLRRLHFAEPASRIEGGEAYASDGEGNVRRSYSHD
jgi:hypothetical protein